MPRLAIIAIVMTGFFLTGDIPAGMQGGLRLAKAAADLGGQLSAWWRPAARAASAAVADPPMSGPAARPEPSRQRIPAVAVNRVQLDQLHPGDRLLLWCGQPGRFELLAVDLIDPARGEGLLFRHLDKTADLPELAAAILGTPQRIVLDPPVVERTTTLSLRLAGSGLAGHQEEVDPTLRIGPLVAVLPVTR